MSELTDRMAGTPDLNAERLARLKELFPDFFDAEGNLKPEEIMKLGTTDKTETEKFEFRWFGKSEAKRNAFNPGFCTLVADAKRSVNPQDADGNMIIEGENLEVLKCLLPAYRGRIKCIYIDPPYNTGKDFVYSDKWDMSKEDYWEHAGITVDGVKVDTNTDASGRYHSNWLNMMFPRLLLARQLLREDGVIFISIDDTEVHNLRKISDEVFGEENFVASVIWEKKYSPQNDAKWLSDNHDYVLIYSRNKEIWRPELLPRTEEANARYENSDNDPRGPWKSSDLTVKTYSKEYDYQIITPTGRKVNPPKGGCWRVSRDKYQEMVKDNRIWFGDSGTNVPSIKRFLSEVKEGMTSLTIWKREEVGDNQEARRVIRELFGDISYFDTPKSVGLIKKILQLSVKKEYPDYVLDFFAGSGTTGHAVMELNKEDGGNRKFILVQIPELTDKESEAYKAGFRKISDITIERNKRVIKKIEKESKSSEKGLFDKDKKPRKNGFRAYKLAKSHFPAVDFKPDPVKSEQENLKDLREYVRQKEDVIHGLYDQKNVMDEVLLKNGFLLDYQSEKAEGFKANTVWRVRDAHKEALLCLDPQINDSILPSLEPLKEKVFICLEQSLSTTLKWNLKHLLGEKLIAF